MRDKPTQHRRRANAPVSYRAVAIGEKLEGRGSLAMAINKKGQTVIMAGGDAVRSYLWSDNEIIKITHPRQEWNFWAYGLNDQGTVVGGTGPSRDKQLGFFWKDGRMTLLSTLEDRNTYAIGITNDEIVYGVSYSQNNVARAVYWKKGKITEIKVADTDTFISGVNSAGPFTGYTLTQGKARAFISHKNHQEFLPWACIGSAINTQADVAGTFFPPGERDTEPFLYADKKLTRIRTLGGSQTRAQGINDQGWTVGQSLLRAPQWHGFLWCGNRLYDLNTLLTTPDRFVVKNAMGINNHNFIVGSAIVDGKEVACLLIPEQ